MAPHPESSTNRTLLAGHILRRTVLRRCYRGGSEASYLFLGTGTKLPADLATRVSQARRYADDFGRGDGVATATSSSPDFAAKVSAVRGVDGVARDRIMQWSNPGERVVEAEGMWERRNVLQPANGRRRRSTAPEAWDLGARGTGVRVAVIDGGLNNTHIDLNGSVDVARSRSFVAGFNFNQDVAGFSHATHVAGIIAARDNGVGNDRYRPGRDDHRREGAPQRIGVVRRGHRGDRVRRHHRSARAGPGPTSST